MKNEITHGSIREKQKEDTRKKLLDISLYLFIHRGYSETKLRDIASNANVSTGLFFHYFQSKEEILIEHIKTASIGVSSVMKKLQEKREPYIIFKEITEMLLASMEEEYYRNLYLLVNHVHSLESIPASVKKLVDSGQPIQASTPIIRKGQKKR